MIVALPVLFSYLFVICRINNEQGIKVCRVIEIGCCLQMLVRPLSF